MVDIPVVSFYKVSLLNLFNREAAEIAVLASGILWLAISLESPYFCELRLHDKYQLARLCRTLIFEKVPYPCLVTQTAECSSSLGPVWESNQVPFGWQLGTKAMLTD